MTVSSTSRRAGPFTGNGVTTSFPFTFKVFAAADLEVTHTDSTTGLETVLTLNSDYSVTLNADQDASPGGSITYPLTGDELAATETLAAVSDAAYEQELDISNAGRFLPQVVEDALDKLAILTQQLKEKLGRALLFSVNETAVAGTLPIAADRVGLYLAFDASGNPIASSGTGADAGLRTDLAASGGSNLVRFLQAGTGALARTVQSKLRDVVSAKDFGAVGDGVTNDAPALQAAIDYLASVGGGTLYVPHGQYLLSTGLVVSTNAITIIGDGPNLEGGTAFINGTITQPAITFGNGVSLTYVQGIRDCYFAQKAGLGPSTGNCALHVTKTYDFHLDRVLISQYPAALYGGLEVVDSFEARMSRLMINNVVNYGAFLKNMTGVSVWASRSDGNLTGWRMEGCGGVYFDGVEAYGNTNYAFHLAALASRANGAHLYTKCVGDTSGSINWFVEDLAGGGVFSHCWAASQISSAVNTFASGWFLSGTYVQDIEFASCIALNNNSHGLTLDTCKRITVTGGRFGEIGGGVNAPPHPNGVSGSGSGISIGASATAVDINGAACDGNTSYGIAIGAGAQPSITGGSCVSNGTGAIDGRADARRISGVRGFNPVGGGLAPAIPASTVAATNNTGVDVMVTIMGGTVTDVTVDGAFVMNTSNCTVYLPAGKTIALTYSVVPAAWSWYGV